jgi:hypothetical protein
MKSTLHARVASCLLFATPGCSLIFTQAPQPESHPPPPCNTLVASPVMDTLLASASFALMVAGVAVATKSCSSNCFNEPVGWGAVLFSGVTGAIFTTSAVVGYQRTSACRSLEESKGVATPAKISASASLLPASPGSTCRPAGDAPRSCPLE